ncbi:MAG: MarC family protein [Bacteroidales bacterium]|nr:MarC family protein [Bacteroidales bacterium]
MHLNIREIISAFMVMFAIIDITGSIPIIIDIKEKTGGIEPGKATLVSFGLILTFFFIGEPFLGIFGVDINSFAVAGAIVILIIGLEMIIGVQFFKHESKKGASIVPIAFPLIAGAGSFTTIISLKAEYQTINILIGVILNMVIVYIVLRSTEYFVKLLGYTGIQVLKKFFGIILLAIAIKLFAANIGFITGHGH